MAFIFSDYLGDDEENERLKEEDRRSIDRRMDRRTPNPSPPRPIRAVGRAVGARSTSPTQEAISEIEGILSLGSLGREMEIDLTNRSPIDIELNIPNDDYYDS